MSELVENEWRRKERKDKGSIFLTDRDERVLEWIGEMMVVRVDQLQRLLGRQAGQGAKYEGIIGEKAVEQVVKRWKKLGLASGRKFFHKEGEFVWLTKEGLKAFGLPYKKPFNETITYLRHYYWTNEVRLWVEDVYAGETQWISDRRLRVENDKVAGHYADGVVVNGDEKAAIEVELSNKNIRATTNILQALATKYDNVWYFTNIETHNTIQRRIIALTPDIQESFTIRMLKEITSGTDK